MTLPNVLEVRDLSVGFRAARGRVKALRGIDLTIPADRVVGIVGESGCGKSTLIASILRLLPPNAEVGAGSAIRFQGRDLLALGEGALRDLRGPGISVVFQDPMTALNPVIPVGRQMTDILYRLPLPAAAKRRRAAEMLERVGIPDAAQRLRDYPHQFSGGMRQRICIAMALMMGPQLLIADEPTTALDVTMEAQIIHLMRRLRAEAGCSMLFVSHNLGLIAELCDEVVVMYAGEVVESGTVHDLFHRARHPYTRLLLECDPARLDTTQRTLPTIAGSVPDMAALPPGCVFAPRCPQRFEPCAAAVPPAYRIAEGHAARCFLAGP